MLLGLSLHTEVIQKLITLRVQRMLEEGFIAEVRSIGKKYGWSSPALNVTGYRPIGDVIVHEKRIDDAMSEVVRAHIALYKKQVTWLKRNAEILWLEGNDRETVRNSARFLVARFLRS